MSQQEKKPLYRLHLLFFITHRIHFGTDAAPAAAVLHKLGGMAGGW